MSENTSSGTVSMTLEKAEIQPLSSIGFVGKSSHELTADIVIAMIHANMLSSIAVPSAFVNVFQAISGTYSDAPAAPAAEIEKPTAAQIKKSITPDSLTSFIDGKPYKTLRRHLATHGLTPEGYRSRYGLDPDYPMVAKSYSDQRAALAKSIGLGVPAKNRKAAAG